MPRDIVLTSKISGKSFVTPIFESNEVEQVRSALRAHQSEAEVAWACEGACWHDASTVFTLNKRENKVEGAGNNKGGDFTVRGTEMQDGLGFDLVFTNRHGEWPVAVKWGSSGKALRGSEEVKASRASFEVEEVILSHGQAFDVLLYDAHGEVLLDLESLCNRVPFEMQYLWTDVDNAKNQRQKAQTAKAVKQAEKQAEQWTTFRDVTTFGTELVTEVARLLMNGKTVSGWWMREEVMPGSGQTITVEQSWDLAGSPAGCFCLTCGKGQDSSTKWRSVEDFVDFFAEKNDKGMAALFVGMVTKSTDEICRVEGTLQRAALQKMLGAGY